MQGISFEYSWNPYEKIIVNYYRSFNTMTTYGKWRNFTIVLHFNCKKIGIHNLELFVW